MVADLRHVIFSLLRLKMRECKKTRGQQSWTMLLLPVFSFSGIPGKKGKIRQKEGENTTHKICGIFALHDSICHIFAFSRSKYKNTKRQRSLTLLSLCIFRIITFLHCCKKEIIRLKVNVKTGGLKIISSNTFLMQ
jgi:hypothetical protein